MRFGHGDAIEALTLLQVVEEERWCIIPPNQETSDWSIYRHFDGEFGYQDELATGPTVIEALAAACRAATESSIRLKAGGIEPGDEK